MIVTDKRPCVFKKYSELEKGDVFKSSDITLMKTERFVDGDDTYNAIVLSNGKGDYMCEDQLIEPLEAELIIKGASKS